MLLFTNPASLLLALAPGWWSRVEPYLNHPGFEAWRFINLAIFVIALLLAARWFGMRQMFRDRKEIIRRDLAKAQEERDAALAKLKEVEERLARLDTEVVEIQERSKREAAEESERIGKSTETEITKLGEQAQRDIETAGKVARHELRRYAAEQSVSLAEQVIRREMKPEDDARLIDDNIQEIGGAAQ